jgi:hypothetical protein
MRVFVFVAMIVLVPAEAMAATDIVAACYQTCADSTHSNPEYKACVARAADKADAALNIRRACARSPMSASTTSSASRRMSCASRKPLKCFPLPVLAGPEPA